MSNNLTVSVPIGIIERGRQLKVKFSEITKAAILAEIARIEADQINGVVKNPNVFHRQDDTTTPIVKGD
jgi:hypothetical protein